MSPMDLTNDERNILEMVRSMLEETEFAVPQAGQDGIPVLDERAKIKQLGSAVVRLWAETFKGTHIFDIVKLIGSSLEIYAQLLEKSNEGNG
jgi:limonene-1,2-epoxide hydrolase